MIMILNRKHDIAPELVSTIHYTIQPNIIKIQKRHYAVPDKLQHTTTILPETSTVCSLLTKNDTMLIP